MERDQPLTEPRRDEPFYFGDPKRPLAGWLHRPPDTMDCRVAVVLCGPFGHEALCTYRMLRTLACRLALAGIAVLRFDYEATGNSAGATHELDHPWAWRSNTLAALHLMKCLLPGVPCAIAGVRLGALLALDAAVHHPGLAGVLLIGPPTSGKQFLRELNALHRATEVMASSPPDAIPQALGYPLPPSLTSFINTLELNSAVSTGAEQLLLIDRAERPMGASLLDRLTGRANAVDVRVCPGMADLLVDAHLAALPDVILDASVEFLSRLARSGAARRLPSAIPPELSLGATAIMPVDGPSGSVSETLTFIDADHQLFGIVTKPRAGAPRRDQQLMLVSSGSNPGYGPNRLYLNLARRLASAGMSVLRLDISGIGDSLPHGGAPDNVVYPANAAADLKAAADFLLASDPAPVTAGGVCSGGYHAMLASKVGVPLSGMLIINPLRFAPVTSAPLEERQTMTIAEVQRYGRSARTSKAWVKLLTGQVNVRRIVGVFLERSVARIRQLAREALRHTRWHVADDFGWELERLAERGIDSLFVFSARDPGAALLAEFAGSAARSLEREGRLRIIEIPDADHTFTLVHQQIRLIDSLVNKLGAPP